MKNINSVQYNQILNIFIMKICIFEEFSSFIRKKEFCFY